MEERKILEKKVVFYLFFMRLCIYAFIRKYARNIHFLMRLCE
ncbi:CLUMA_CG015818, isoform A [Clunio marinus]|uniref:CLUMA_CG015818, isoform A n=1 Tax=Clunio marinus TaxID=568069 RepID=A0A1J1IRA2_9DIPT|nr:CLUMA_CG015818, isoform A [Clunio marinus]